MFGGLTHEPAVRLAARLAEVAPGDLEHVFLSDSGSVAVEVAVKMCLQHWRSLGRPEKRRLLTWRGGYHGDTWQPMSVCDPEGGMHHLWSGALPVQVFADAPPAGFAAEPDPAYVAHLHERIERHAHELAAVVVEPVVQGAGGMRFHSPGYVRALREACDAHGVLLVLDEIATGFGRTGELFAADHAGVVPDVMCVGKALTGGYLSMAATLCTPRVAEGIARGSVPVLAGARSDVHGQPAGVRRRGRLAGSAAVPGLAGAGPAGVRGAAQRAGAGRGAARGAGGERARRDRGAAPGPRGGRGSRASAAAVRTGVWLRPFRDMVYAMPPYITGEQDVARIAAAMCAAAREG